MTPRRVVITGCGLVSALGNSTRQAFDRLHLTRNCVIHSPELDTYTGLGSHLAAPATEFQRPEHYSRKVVRTMGRVSILALNATEQALAQAQLLDTPQALQNGRTGVAYGSSSGSVDAIANFYTVLQSREVRNVTSSTYIKMMSQTTAVNLSVHFGTTGRLIPTSTACTSGSLAIGSAYEAIRYGLQDIMIAGGAEEFSPTQVAIFDTLFATSHRNDEPEATPRPFDRLRDGLVIGEGAGTVILEERERALARGVPILGEVFGFATNTDGRHVTQPNPATMAQAMRLALQDAGLSPADVGYINAHGTATDLGDIAEGTATAEVFGSGVPVCTIKSYTGHTLGACGALEAILTLEMLRGGWLAPNLNLTDPDPRCGGLDFVTGEGRATEAKIGVSNNFAFGGVNTSLVLGVE